MNNKLEIKFSANLDNVTFSRNLIQAFLYPLNPTISFISEIKTIISEAVTNAIIHGYELDDSKDVLMKLKYDDNYVYIEITDYGKGIIDIEQAKMPLFTTKKSEERSGLGFTIMEVFSDLFEVTSNINVGTTLKIQKKIPDFKNEQE